MQIIIITGKSINVQQISSFNGLDSSKQKEYFVFVGGEALYTFCRFFSFGECYLVWAVPDFNFSSLPLCVPISHSVPVLVIAIF